MGNRDIEAARRYHNLTKHSYTSVRSSPHSLDWDNRPMPYKVYPGAGAVSLPRELDLSTIPTLKAISSEAPTDAQVAIDIDSLTRILFCAGGLTRNTSVGGDQYHFRAAASAGALYPVEIYVATADVDGLEAGLYHFSPADLKLRGLRHGDWRATASEAAANRKSLASARAIIFLSAIFWRSTWKYRARAYRYCFWDAGTILANLTAAATAEGVGCEVVTAFADPALEALLGIDGEREGFICMVALGDTGKPIVESPKFRSLDLDTIPLSKEEVAYPDLQEMHRESRLESVRDAAEIADVTIQTAATTSGVIDSASVASLDFDQCLGLGETIVRRGSTRTFAQTAIAADELSAILSASSRHPRADFPPLVETYLVVNAVEGLESGAYYFRRDASQFDLLKRGSFRGEAGYLCLEQRLGYD
ncbi:MAG TPA: SagB family peptide dehydrogenase [Candidatus Binataceae bacterium]|nr:SagB family peptide dehydrogenase [Candidatus Binataceae bacterium]